MSDVVASVTAVLSQTSLQAAISSAVPPVLQRHLQAVAAEARRRLLPGLDDGGTGLPTNQVRRDGAQLQARVAERGRNVRAP